MLRKFIVGCVYLFSLVVFRVQRKGQENIKKRGAYIICANHRSNWDAPILVSNTKRRVHVMAKAEMFKNAFVKWFGKVTCVFPVKRGMRDIESIKHCLKLLKDGEILMIFPEGTRNGLEKNGKAQNGVAYLALRTGVPVIPVGIQGKMKPFRKVKLNYGKPLDFSEYKTNKPEKEVLDKVSKEIMDNIIMLTNEKI